jgi:hypothetical protein
MPKLRPDSDSLGISIPLSILIFVACVYLPFRTGDFGLRVEPLRSRSPNFFIFALGRRAFGQPWTGP